jgi:hypothetical protein
MYASQHDWLEQKYLHLQGIAYALHIHTLQVPFVTDEAEGLVILNFLYPYCKKKATTAKETPAGPADQHSGRYGPLKMETAIHCVGSD